MTQTNIIGGKPKIIKGNHFTLFLLILGTFVMTNVSAANQYDLHEAVVNTDLGEVRRLLQNGADINQLGSRRYGYGSALHLAVREGQLDIARLLIDWGAEVDVLDTKDFTPLHNAAWNGNLEMTRLLLEAGADIEASTYDGDTPLSLAQNNDQAQVAKFIQAKIQAPSATRTKVESPVIDDSLVNDISGTYIVETTASGRGPAIGVMQSFKKMNGKLIVLKQTGNTITGSVGSQSNWMIKGTREGNIIHFYIIRPGNEIDGTWQVNANATKLVGKWNTNGGGGASGKWNLTKIGSDAAPVIDVSGTYISEVTGPYRKNMGLFGANPEVKLVQEGSKVTGTFESTGKLWGDVNGDSIKLDYYSRGYLGKVFWKVKPGSNELVGTWAYKDTIGKDGNWTLTRIE